MSLPAPLLSSHPPVLESPSCGVALCFRWGISDLYWAAHPYTTRLLHVSWFSPQTRGRDSSAQQLLVCSLASLPLHPHLLFLVAYLTEQWPKVFIKLSSVSCSPCFQNWGLTAALSSMLCHLRQSCSWFSVEATSVFPAVMCEVLLLVESKLVLSWSISYIVVFLEQVFFPVYCFSALISRALSILKPSLSAASFCCLGALCCC